MCVYTQVPEKARRGCLNPQELGLTGGYELAPTGAGN